MIPDWPLFGLRLECGPVRLRAVRDEDLPALTDLFPDDFDLDPSAERFPGLAATDDRRRLFTQGFWHSRGTWSPGSWCLDLLVEADGVPVGVQSLEGDDFARLRTVDTASWLTPPARGRGLGVAMRAAVLGLAFDHLGAEVAVSSAEPTNTASLGVSRRLGYAENGTVRVQTPRGPVDLVRVRLHRADRLAATDVLVDGVTPCLPWFGVSG